MPHSDTGERAITRGELEWPVDTPAGDPVLRTLRGGRVGPGVAGVAAGDEVFALTPFDRRRRRS
jgi:hypothetical protein